MARKVLGVSPEVSEQIFSAENVPLQVIVHAFEGRM
jgi:hypothetical protein